MLIVMIVESGEGIERSNKGARSIVQTPMWNPVKELKAFQLNRNNGRQLFVESGEGIESHPPTLLFVSFSYIVESGEGIESLPRGTQPILGNSVLWNPVKELKASMGGSLPNLQVSLCGIR